MALSFLLCKEFSVFLFMQCLFMFDVIVFEHLSVGSLADAVGWATSTWYDRPGHVEAMRRQSMRRDFSWKRAALAYEALCRRAYRARRGREPVEDEQA